MSDGMIFKYGNYDFDPRPTLGIKTEAQRTPDGSGFGRVYTYELQGLLILTGAAELEQGISGVFKKITDLRTALDTDGKLLVVACNDLPLISGYPKIEDFSINDSPDQYTRRANYTVVFSMDSIRSGSGADPFNSYNTYPPFIKSCEETWDVEFADERLPVFFNNEMFGYKLAVTHSVNVEARLHYTGITTDGFPNQPWQDAINFASGRLGYDERFAALSGIIGLPGTGFDSLNTYNHIRKVQLNKTAGSIQAQESFIVTPTGNQVVPNNAIETFNINTEQSEGVVRVTIQGEIEGLAKIYYNNFNVPTTSGKYPAASGYFKAVQPNLFARASGAYSQFAETESCYNTSAGKPYRLNQIAKTKTISSNPIEGKINYSYEYDTTPIGCITGDCILSQNITIDDSLPADVFAKQVVIGRALGPILQDIGTITDGTRTVSIELVVLPPTSCNNLTELYSTLPTGQIESFIDMVYTDLSGQYGQVFIASNSQNWNFTTGRYNKSIAFTYGGCVE